MQRNMDRDKYSRLFMGLFFFPPVEKNSVPFFSLSGYKIKLWCFKKGWDLINIVSDINPDPEVQIFDRIK